MKQTWATWKGNCVSGELSDTRWPSRCCVPAFLGRATAALSPRLAQPDSDELRAALARATGVILAPTDCNPWVLPTSSNDDDWGVTPAKAKAAFSSVKTIVGVDDDLVLEIVPISHIGFELYEDAASDLAASGAIVAIAFDYSDLQPARSASASRQRAFHVVRLTPLGKEQDHKPNVLSSEFQFDYNGDIWVFDDSLEMMPAESVVPWRALVRACRRIDGALWAVRRP